VISITLLHGGITDHSPLSALSFTGWLNSMKTLFSVRSLRVAFGERAVLSELSFEVYEGEILAIIGPNGSGKTVLLKTLLGLIPYTGTIVRDSQVRIGYVPQKILADRQMPLLAADLLKAKMRFLHLAPEDLRSVAALVGLSPEIMAAGIGVLSGGQFQKVLIAMALLGNPNVLLFDEPTASLDELEEERIYELLSTLQKERRLTVLLVSHDLSIVHHFADRVLCLARGATCIGTPDNILTPEILEAAYAAPLKYHYHRQSDTEAWP